MKRRSGFEEKGSGMAALFKDIPAITAIVLFSSMILCLIMFYGIAFPDDITKDVAVYPALPFENEELNYRVSWSRFISAGSATLSLSTGTYADGMPVLKGQAVARSAKWMRVLGIDVEDTIETLFDPQYRFSYFFQAKIKETDYKKTKSITFDWDNFIIKYIERDEAVHFELKEWTHDVLSALYYVRTLPLKEEESFYVRVFDDGKEYLLEVKVIARENLKIQGQEVQVFKSKIILKTKGIFNRKGDVYIWFSDDARKIPVQMQCDIFLGFFHVELVDARAFFRYR
ncbi:DUF3108 domain-containing protein [bacterium]|nr:DUF3108 domain-containing protein [bacterium]